MPGCINLISLFLAYPFQQPLQWIAKTIDGHRLTLSPTDRTGSQSIIVSSPLQYQAPVLSLAYIYVYLIIIIYVYIWDLNHDRHCLYKNRLPEPPSKRNLIK